MIKILIVDDSKYIRFNLERMLSKDHEIEICGSVGNGIEAIKFLELTHVDVIILDFFMPKMNGLDTLEQIMKRFPTPTIMLTLANRQEHATLFFKALRLGAFDIVTKPSGTEELYVDKIEDIIKNKIHHAALAKEKIVSAAAKDFFFKDLEQRIEKGEKGNIKGIPAPIPGAKREVAGVPSFNLVIIGASTGGPTCVFELIKRLIHKQGLSILIVQHMPAGFTKQFAERLDKVVNYKVFEPVDSETMKAGIGYVAPGDFHTTLDMEGGHVIIRLDKREKVMGLRPCIDYSMISAAFLFKNHCYGVLLSGMGQDGMEGMQKIKENGGTTIVQSPGEALISSMPDHVIKAGAADHVLTIEQISDLVNQIVN